MMRNILIFSLLSLVCMLGCGGLGSGGGYNVGGKVTFPGGKPLTRGQVTFTSGYFTGTGDVFGESGTYSISGPVPAGKYKVAVQASDNSLIDPKYNDPETSGLVCEVKGPTGFDIQVEPPK